MSADRPGKLERNAAKRDQEFLALIAISTVIQTNKEQFLAQLRSHQSCVTSKIKKAIYSVYGALLLDRLDPNSSTK
ncbi:11372_t:CDS:2, partial [Dentiscutata erythropus]